MPKKTKAAPPADNNVVELRKELAKAENRVRETKAALDQAMKAAKPQEK